MTYEEALEYIHSVVWLGSRPGLERITELENMLGNRYRDLKFIHITGTNGKGSTSAMLSSILTAAGYKTGLFTSPYIRFFNERMAINNCPIEDGELARVTEKVKACADKMKDPPTEFELITAIAIEYFADNECDYVVFEVGMGGRLDSTNVIERSVCSVITGVALDHTAFLGDSVEKVAFEKAGIIKNGCPVVLGALDEKAASVIKNVAMQRNSEIYRVDASRLCNISYSLTGAKFDYKDRKDIKISLGGAYQPKNASLVLEVIDVLRASGAEISEKILRTGLENTVWHGRFELLENDPPVIIDGGHNPEGVRACVDSVKAIFGDARVNILSGVMQDKDYTEMIAMISEIADEVFTLTPNNPRAFDAFAYAEQFRAQGMIANGFRTVDDALLAALESSRKKGIPLVIVGSLYMYSEVVSAFGKICATNNCI